MNRLATILALVAALALSTAVGASAAPGADGPPTAGAAAAKAKKKAAKRRAGNCKGQPKKRAKARKRANRKATGRARRSTADSAQARRRGARRKAGRKKAGRCKAGKRGKGKRSPGTKRDPAPSAGFATGQYEDEAKGVTVTNEDGASASVSFVIPQKPACPAPGALIGLEGTITETGKGVRIVGEGGSFLAVKAVMSIESDLSYLLEIDYTLQFPGAAPCTDQATITGKLAEAK